MTNWRERARARMKEIGVSQERLGEAFGMGPAAIQKWLAGDRQPSLDQINQIADVLDVTRTWLTYGLDSASTIDGLSEKPHIILRHLIRLERDGRLRPEQWDALAAMITAFAPEPMETSIVKSIATPSKNGTTG